MTTQEIRIQAQITLEVPIELSKEGLYNLFEDAKISIVDNYNETHSSFLDIIEIEEEAQIYGTEDN